MIRSPPPRWDNHLGSNCIRSLPTKGRIAGYTELARISQRVMRTSSSDLSISPNGFYGMSGLHHSGLMFAARITFPHFSVSEAISLP
jgi:hypothetical protein